MSGAILGIDPTRVSTKAEFRLGSIGGYDHPTYGYQEYIYGQAGSAIPAGGAAANVAGGVPASTQGEWVALTQSNDGPGESTNSPVGFPQVEMSDQEFGWFLVKGQGGVLVYASAAIGTRLYTTATAGYLEDVSTSAISIVGVTLTVVQGGASGVNTSARLTYPMVALNNVT